MSSNYNTKPLNKSFNFEPYPDSEYKEVDLASDLKEKEDYIDLNLICETDLEVDTKQICADIAKKRLADEIKNAHYPFDNVKLTDRYEFLKDKQSLQDKPNDYFRVIKKMAHKAINIGDVNDFKEYYNLYHLDILKMPERMHNDYKKEFYVGVKENLAALLVLSSQNNSSFSVKNLVELNDALKEIVSLLNINYIIALDFKNFLSNIQYYQKDHNDIITNLAEEFLLFYTNLGIDTDKYDLLRKMKMYLLLQ